MNPGGDAPERDVSGSGPDDAQPHHPIVLDAPDPLVFKPLPGSPAVASRLARLGTTLVRLEGVRDSSADSLRRHVEALGGAVETERFAGRTDLYLSIRERVVPQLIERVAGESQALTRLVEEIDGVLGAYRRTQFELRCRDLRIVCGARPLLMGVVNCTPDSFYESSAVAGDAAVRRALALIAEGADMIDIGGESTRPGSEPVPAAEEISRVEPVVRELARQTDIPISIDTMKSEVADAALAAGAVIVNDVTGLAHDPRLGAVIRKYGAAVVLMHTRGVSAEMYALARYQDVLVEVIRELRAAVARARAAGIQSDQIVIDPGIGFAKRAEHSLALLNNLAALRSLGAPLLVGTSRKSFIGAVLDLPADDRLEGTAASLAAAVLAGAHIMRVHDVRAMRRVVDLAAAIRTEGAGWIS